MKVRPPRHPVLYPVPHTVRDRRADLDHQPDDSPHNQTENPKAPAGKEAGAGIEQRGGARCEKKSASHKHARFRNRASKPQSHGERGPKGQRPKCGSPTKVDCSDRGGAGEYEVQKELHPDRGFVVDGLKAQREVNMRQHALEIAERRSQRIFRPLRGRSDDDDRVLQGGEFPVRWIRDVVVFDQ